MVVVGGGQISEGNVKIKKSLNRFCNKVYQRNGKAETFSVMYILLVYCPLILP